MCDSSCQAIKKRLEELEAALQEARLHIPVNEFYVAIHAKLARVLGGETK